MSSDRDQDVIENEEVELLTIQKGGTPEAKSNDELEYLLLSQHESSVDPRTVRLRSYSDGGEETASNATSSSSTPVSSEILGNDVFIRNAGIPSNRTRVDSGEMFSWTFITKVDTHSEPRKDVSATSSDQVTDNSDVTGMMLGTGGKTDLKNVDISAQHSKTNLDAPLKVGETVVNCTFLEGVEQQLVPPSGTKYIRKLRGRPPTANEDLNAIIPCPISETGSDQPTEYLSPGEERCLPANRYLPLQGREPGGRPEDDDSWSPDSSQLPEAAIRPRTSLLSGDQDAASSVSDRFILVGYRRLTWGILMAVIGLGVCAVAWGIFYRFSQTDVSLIAAIFILGLIIYIVAARYIYKSVNWVKICRVCGF